MKNLVNLWDEEEEDEEKLYKRISSHLKDKAPKKEVREEDLKKDK